MRTTVDPNQVQLGSAVFASDGGDLGKVEEVGEDYILVRKGMVFAQDLFIPITAVERVDVGGVYLEVSKTDAETRGWDQPPASYERLGGFDRGSGRTAR